MSIPSSLTISLKSKLCSSRKFQKEFSPLKAIDLDLPVAERLQDHSEGLLCQSKGLLLYLQETLEKSSKSLSFCCEVAHARS